MDLYVKYTFIFYNLLVKYTFIFYRFLIHAQNRPRLSKKMDYHKESKAVDLLTQSKLIHKIQSTNANGIPLGAEINAKFYKMILIDVGLVSSVLGLHLHQFKSIDDLMLINKGALTEQVTGQLLRLLQPYYVEPSLFYWTRISQNSSAEIDYLIQNNQELIPIEVKAGSEGKLRSLHQFMHLKPWQRAIRFYAGHPNNQTVKTKTTTGNDVTYQLLSLPFYLIEQTYQMLSQQGGN